MNDSSNLGAQRIPARAKLDWRKTLLWIAAVSVFVILARPIDLSVTGLFYRADGGFIYGRLWPLEAVYFGTHWVVDALVAFLLIGLIGSYWPALAKLRAARGKFWFAILALAIGPGLITHVILKDHWGRPRPSQIENFGGQGHYVRPVIPSAQCDHNCSFVSGHAVAGFFVITGAWLWPRHRRRWLVAGLVVGGLVGLVRIVQGAHFLSDVLGALAVVWLTNAALARWLPRRFIDASSESSPKI